VTSFAALDPLQGPHSSLMLAAGLAPPRLTGITWSKCSFSVDPH
jgi:hypothetical protein